MIVPNRPLNTIILLLLLTLTLLGRLLLDYPHQQQQFVVVVNALPSYLQRIPNGDKVVSPSGEVWPGVGHFRSSGGGERNSFGKDFAAAGYEWTEELCRKDSDCDGLSNGQELGDPDCIWFAGEIPQFDTGITHPGIADTERSTVVSGVVKGGSSDTTSTTTEGRSTCSDFSFEDLPSGYLKQAFVMPGYSVPTQQTTYAKYAIRLDLDEDSYAVHFAPIINSPEVVHHMILYHCDSEPTDFLTPNTEGKMACTNLITAWAVGGEELCMPPNVGVELDASKPWYILDMHYDNPRGLTGIEDTSGLQVTHFPKSSSAMASQDYQAAGWLWAGANAGSFQIPPRRSVFEVTAECTFPKLPASGITVFTMALHAHKIGRKIWTEVIRSPAAIEDLQAYAASCPSTCGTMCSQCWSKTACCGSLDPNICNQAGSACCSDCATLCAGCEGCYAKTTECNPNGYEEGGGVNDTGSLDPIIFDLGCDTRYDFDLQEARPLPEFQTIYPTDKLVTHCVYDSSDRSRITYGGDESDNEMCIGFYLYYPKVPTSDVQCMTRAKVDVGDGNHVCNIRGQTIVDDTQCYDANNGNFSSSSSSSLGFSDLPTWLQLHILSMQLSMGFLLPVGVLIPMAFRQSFKENDKWFRYHRVIQTLGVLLVLVGFTAAFVGMAMNHFSELHHRLGLVVFILTLLQPLNAFCRPHHSPTEECSGDEGDANDPTSSLLSPRSLWEMLHKTLGRLVILGGWANIFLGLSLLESMYGISTGMTKVLKIVQISFIVFLSILALYRAISSRRSSNTTTNDDDAGARKRNDQSTTMKITEDA